MDLIDIVYHLSRLNLNATDYNKILDLVKKSGKEYLFHQSFLEVRDEIFNTLEKEVGQQLNIKKY